MREKQREIQSRFEEDSTAIQGGGITEYWELFKEVIQRIMNELLGTTTVEGRRKKKTTIWWNHEVWQAIRNKQESFHLWMKERTVERRREYEIYRNIAILVERDAQNEMWKRFGEELEFDFENTRKLLYSMAKKYRSRDTPANRISIKNKEGEILTHPEDIQNRWIEYFGELYNVGAAVEDVEENIIDMEIAQEFPITLQEVKSALKSMKNNKSPGPDNIAIEVKAGGEKMTSVECEREGKEKYLR